MDYRHLKYFMEVAQQKSFSKAARSLHISQSAISRMIKSLEDEMGVTLFIRNAKTVELTAPGTIFLNYAKRALFVFEHLKSDFENEEIGILYLIRICGLSKSNGEARRLIEQGGISLNGEKVADTNLKVSLNLEEIVIKKGKKIYHRVIAL